MFFFLILALLFLVITAISSAIGLTGSGLQILDAIKVLPDRTSKRNFIWRLALITFLLTVVFMLAGIPSFLSLLPNPEKGQRPSGTSQASVSTTTPTFMSTPAPTPTPSPTPEPKTYKADWSTGMDGWVQSNGWSSVDGMLVNDGQDYDNDGHPTAIAPQFPQDIPDYSVQVDIQVARYTDEGGISGLASFGVVVRSPDQVEGYKVGVCVSGGIYSCGSNSAPYELMLSDGSFFQSTPVKESQFHPDKGVWYTYRVDVKGNTLTVWTRRGSDPFTQMFQATDNKYLSVGRVGLWSYRSQINVRNFTITAL
jgi:hypothetical protein